MSELVPREHMLEIIKNEKSLGSFQIKFILCEISLKNIKKYQNKYREAALNAIHYIQEKYCVEYIWETGTDNGNYQKLFGWRFKDEIKEIKRIS